MKKVSLVILFVLMIFISFAVFANTKPIICSETEDVWVNELPHQKKGNMHYFIGFSTNKKTPEEAMEVALQNAYVQVSSHVGKTVGEECLDYRVGKVSLYKCISKLTSALIDLKKYETVASCRGGEDGLHNFAVKIAVTDEDFQRMIVKDRSITGWKFEVSQCSQEQAEEMKRIFEGVTDAKHLNWNLRLLKEKPDFKDVPKTAYFAEVEAKCLGEMMHMSIRRHNLVENKIDTSGREAKGRSVEELKIDLHNVLDEEIPIDNNISEELFQLISDARNFKKKWRLDPEKAKALWQKVVDYKGDNPYQYEAVSAINNIQKELEKKLKLISGEQEAYEGLKKNLINPSFNKETLCEQISKYIERYGALVGSVKVDKLFDYIDKNRKKAIRKKVFYDNANLWQDGCREGDLSKCYILSMNNTRESTALKEKACENVERACFDLYGVEKNKSKKADYAEKSCYLGNKFSCFYAAVIYYGVNKKSSASNVEKSKEIWGDSCLAGLSESCYMLGLIFDKNTSRKVQSDEEKSDAFYKMACEQGVSEACSTK